MTWTLDDYGLGGGGSYAPLTGNQVLNPGGGGGFSLSGLMGGLGGGIGGMSYLQMILGTLAGAAQAITTGKIDYETERSGDDIRDLLFQAAQAMRDIAGDLDFPEVDINPRDLLFALVNPQNRALSGATFDTLTQLGLPAGGVISQGGPLVEARNILGRSGLKKKQLNRATEYLTGVRKIDPEGKNPGLAPALRALAELGYTGDTAFEDFQAAQVQFNEQARRLEELSAEGAEERFAQRQGILGSAYQSIEDLLGGDGLLGLEQRVIQSRLSDLADMREQALAAANRGGYNPAAELENVADAENDLRNVDALERAITLLGGGIETSQRAINAVNSPIQNLGNLGAITSTGLVNAANLASNQSNFINDILARQEFFNAQGNWGEQLQVADILLNALGPQTQGGMIDILSDLQKATSFARGSEQFVNSFMGAMGGGGSSGGGAPGVNRGGNLFG